MHAVYKNPPKLHFLALLTVLNKKSNGSVVEERIVPKGPYVAKRSDFWKKLSAFPPLPFLNSAPVFLLHPF